MRISELDTLRANMDAEYRKNMEAIEIVRAMLEKQVTPLSERIEEASAEDPPLGLSKAVRKWIEESEGTFTTSELRDALKAAGMEVVDASLRGLMKRLYVNGRVVIVEQGSGRKPTTYQKA